MTATVAAVGVVLLVWFAVLIGVSMDTEAQRAERRRTAEERRARAEERLRLEALVQRLADERRRAAQGCPHPDCPLRRKKPGGG